MPRAAGSRLLAAVAVSAVLHGALLTLMPWSAGTGGGEKGTPALVVSLRAGEASTHPAPLEEAELRSALPAAPAETVSATEAMRSPAAAPPAAGGRFLREGEFDFPPRPLNEIVPIYPDAAVAQQLKGHVELEVQVDREGRVVDARVLAARPVEVFDVSALRAVRQARFAPAKLRGEPVGSILRAVIEYEAP